MYNMVPTSDTESPADSPRPAPIWQGSGGGRCKRCFKYFSSCTEREETTCVSHPGLWEQAGFGLSFKLACGGWTCCSSRDQDSPGCLILNEHLECLDTTEALKKVGANNSSKGFDLDIAAEPSQKQDRLLDTRPQQAGPKEERPGYLRHMYKPGETLPGIALYYRVTVADVKLANGIMGPFLDPGYKTLWIPLPGTQAGQDESNKKPELQRRLADLRSLAAKESLDLNHKEAKYYLEENDNDVLKALAAFRSDCIWEKENAGVETVGVW